MRRIAFSRPYFLKADDKLSRTKRSIRSKEMFGRDFVWAKG